MSQDIDSVQISLQHHASPMQCARTPFRRHQDTGTTTTIEWTTTTTMDPTHHNPEQHLVLPTMSFTIWSSSPVLSLFVVPVTTLSGVDDDFDDSRWKDPPVKIYSILWSWSMVLGPSAAPCPRRGHLLDQQPDRHVSGWTNKLNFGTKPTQHLIVLED